MRLLSAIKVVWQHTACCRMALLAFFSTESSVCSTRIFDATVNQRFVHRDGHKEWDKAITEQRFRSSPRTLMPDIFRIMDIAILFYPCGNQRDLW